MISAWNSLPSTGGVLDVSGGLFGVGSNTQNQLTAKSGITIRGGGAGTGFRALSQSFAGGNRAILEFEGVTNLVLRDFEVDLNDQPIGGIRPGRDTNTWIVSCWVHDAGTSNGHISGDKPSAMIRGFNGHIDLHVIGCLIENSRGDAGCRRVVSPAHGLSIASCATWVIQASPYMSTKAGIKRKSAAVR